MHYTILRSALSRGEAQKLMDSIRSTPNITGYSLGEWLDPANVLVARSQTGTLMGACLVTHFGWKWSEIAVLYVFEPFRGYGVGRSLFAQALVEFSQRHLLVISRNPSVMRMAKHSEFTILNSLSNLGQGYQKYWLTLNIVYEVTWLGNFYRLQEIMRKSRVYPNQLPFEYGLKLAPSAASQFQPYPALETYQNVGR